MELALAGSRFAHQRGNLDAGNRSKCIDHAFRIRLACLGRIEISDGDVRHGKTTVEPQFERTENARSQLDPCSGLAFVESAKNLGWIDTNVNEVCGDAMGFGRRIRVHKAAVSVTMPT